MARITPADRAKKKHEHRHGRKHHTDPAKVARNKQQHQHHARYGISAFGALNPAQFGYSGGFTTDAGNYTGVQAIEGAAGNGSAGGDGGTGDSGGAPS